MKVKKRIKTALVLMRKFIKRRTKTNITKIKTVVAIIKTFQTKPKFVRLVKGI
jgi:hypothetical protein